MFGSRTEELSLDERIARATSQLYKISEGYTIDQQSKGPKKKSALKKNHQKTLKSFNSQPVQVGTPNESPIKEPLMALGQSQHG